MVISRQENIFFKLKAHEWVSCVSCFLMITGMVCSRSLLSLGMVLLLLNALHPSRIKEHWRLFRKSAFAIFSLLLFAAYLLSGIWSEDKANWLVLLQIKLPFLFFPFALIRLPVQNRNWLLYTIVGMLLALFGGMVYSFFFLVADPGHFATGAHLLSPMEGDYIRFTIVLVLAMTFVLFLLANRSGFNIGRSGVAALIGWLVIAVLYIHIQAAKSGLVSFYILYVGSVVYYAWQQRRVFMGILLLAAGGFGLWMSTYLPSMSLQMSVVSTTAEPAAGESRSGPTGKEVYASSVTARLKSYQVALGAMSGQWLLGAGAGDMKKAMEKEYARREPGLPQFAMILPHNQVLCSLLSIGAPLTVLVLLPLIFSTLFKRANWSDPYGILSWLIIFFGLMIEPMLEVQFGIFVFLYFTYLWPAIRSARYGASATAR